MSIARPPRAPDERTLSYFERPSPPDEPGLAGGEPRRDSGVQTASGLGRGNLRPSDRESLSEERWLALFAEGLLDLGSIPVLLRRPEDVCSARCDEVEMYVVLRVESGTTLRGLIHDGSHPAEDVVRAMARLTFSGLVRLM
jgi:hypothetical protein